MYSIYDLRSFLSSKTFRNEKIEHKSSDPLEDIMTSEEQLNYLINRKYQLITDIIDLQKNYTNIDEEFEKELTKYSARSKYRSRILDWLKV